MPEARPDPRPAPHPFDGAAFDGVPFDGTPATAGPTTAHAPLSGTAVAAMTLVRAYQVALAPFTGGACRFTPSCSAYALDAVRLHGAARGLWLAARRIARCHPWGGFGHDPVPVDTPFDGARRS